MDEIFKRAEHNPPHLFIPNVAYMLTASTYQSENIIHAPERKAQWRDAFLKAAEVYCWNVIAWVVLHNHYHVLVESPENPFSLTKFVGSYHKFTARQWNLDDKTPGRQVWWNFWDSCVKSENDFNNRLRYVFWNPVKHGFADKSENYEFSSYPVFLEHQSSFDLTNMEQVSDVPEF